MERQHSAMLLALEMVRGWLGERMAWRSERRRSGFLLEPALLLYTFSLFVFQP